MYICSAHVSSKILIGTYTFLQKYYTMFKSSSLKKMYSKSKKGN